MTASLVPPLILPDPCERTGLSKASPGRRVPLVRLSRRSPGSHRTSSPSKNPLRLGLRGAGREGTGRLGGGWVAGGGGGQRGNGRGFTEEETVEEIGGIEPGKSKTRGRGERNENDVKVGDKSQRTSGIGFIPRRSFLGASPALRNQGPRPTQEGFRDSEVSVFGTYPGPWLKGVRWEVD